MSSVDASVTVSTRSVAAVRFLASTAGSNPMVPGAPDIDTHVKIAACFRPRTLHIEGEIFGDPFPNAEVFVYDGRGNSAMLFHFRTGADAETGPLTELWGSQAGNSLGSFFKSIPTDGDGAILNSRA